MSSQGSLAREYQRQPALPLPALEVKFIPTYTRAVPVPALSLLISAASEQFYPVADKQGRACKSGAARAARALQHDRNSQGRAGVP